MTTFAFANIIPSSTINSTQYISKKASKKVSIYNIFSLCLLLLLLCLRNI